MLYLSGVSNDYMIDAAQNHLYGRLGVLLGPETTSFYKYHVSHYTAWGMDNGCFSNAGAFDEESWLADLEDVIENIDGAHESCRFAVAPDVFDPVAGCGDPVATIERSRPVFQKIRDRGAPAALVFQDGLEFQPELIPWGEFDVAFLGGGDAFKLGNPHNWKPGQRTLTYDRFDEQTIAYARMIHACHERGVPVHMGRVNTGIRLHLAAELGCETADGTMVAFAGRKALASLESWLPKYEAA